MMKLHLSAVLITMGLWSCTQNSTFEEANNTKLQSVIKYNDSVLINSIDFFDVGYADSIVATYGVSILKKTLFTIFFGRIKTQPFTGEFALIKVITIPIY